MLMDSLVNSFFSPKAAMLEKLNKNETLVYCVMLCLWNDGMWEVGFQELLKYSKLTPHTLRKTIKDMDKQGLITVSTGVDKQGHRIANIYRMRRV